MSALPSSDAANVVDPRVVGAKDSGHERAPQPRAALADVPRRAAALVGHEPGAFGSNSARESAFPDERWVERAANPGTFLWLTETRHDEPMPGAAPQADGLIGLIPAALYLERPHPDEVRASFGTDPSSLAFVTQMWVDPAHRGSGAFDALMDAVIAHARATGLRAIALHVYRENVRAASAYRRRGFTLTSPTSPECPSDEDEYVLPLA